MRSDSVLGRGKAILLGEHAVVYGTPAIAMGIERGVHATWKRSNAFELSVTPWDVTITPGDGSDLGRALEAVLADYDAAPPIAIDANAELPAGAGLGCSAALGVAVVRAIDAAMDREAIDSEVAERALAWERVFHGNPSGIDNTMAAHGGIACFVKGEPLESIPSKHPLRFVVGNSNESASTKEMVAEVARQQAREPERFEQTLEAVRSLVANAKLAIQAGDHFGLGQMMNLNHALLSGLMLSTPALEDMCATAREAGARGAKLTGSGGGGCMIALVNDDESAKSVTAAIEAAGFDAFIATAGGST